MQLEKICKLKGDNLVQWIANLRWQGKTHNMNLQIEATFALSFLKIIFQNYHNDENKFAWDQTNSTSNPIFSF